MILGTVQNVAFWRPDASHGLRLQGVDRRKGDAGFDVLGFVCEASKGTVAVLTQKNPFGHKN